MSLRINDINELDLIPRKYTVSLLCAQCNNHVEITAGKARQNISRNGQFICKTCKEPPAKATRSGRQKESAICALCDDSFEVSRESVTRNKRNHNGEYWCHKCASKQSKQKPKPYVNPWLNEEVVKRCKKIMSSKLVKDKISEASKRKWENEQYASKVAISLSEIRSGTRPQLALYQLLDSLNIKYYKESTDTCFNRWSFDCLVPKQGKMSKHLLIECQGDYWHELSKKQTRDRQKFTTIDTYFPDYEIMYIWEHEFNIESRVLDRLKLKIGADVPTVNFDFKQVTVNVCDRKQVRSFLDAYHYLGGRRSGIVVGAFLDDLLIAAVVYSLPVRQNIEFTEEHRELSRLCIHPSYHKYNFASWFLARTYRYLDKSLIIAYADTTYGHNGTIYKAAGFTLSHECRQDYWYIDTENRIARKKVVYDHAVKLGMSESEYVAKYQLIRKWGGKKLCFSKRISNKTG